MDRSPEIAVVCVAAFFSHQAITFSPLCVAGFMGRLPGGNGGAGLVPAVGLRSGCHSPAQWTQACVPICLPPADLHPGNPRQTLNSREHGRQIRVALVFVLPWVFFVTN